MSLYIVCDDKDTVASGANPQHNLADLVPEFV